MYAPGAYLPFQKSAGTKRTFGHLENIVDKEIAVNTSQLILQSRQDTVASILSRHKPSIRSTAIVNVATADTNRYDSLQSTTTNDTVRFAGDCGL